ncbi:protein Turandot B1-like [Drosophila ficusphila]|uniref:protein Turandot B1-like n=1 Tax=Drosophila ficusphila TaxID=30025 RepID=UPI0007E8A040|nr:protein Turandot B1-like [Drosophila ficusphila]
MSSSIFLVCAALLLVSPLCFGYSDQEREADRLKVLEIIRSSLDDETKISRTQELLDIYYRLAPSLSPAQREIFDNFISQHTDEILIEGVPSQGGRRSKYAKNALTGAAKGVATGFFEELGSKLAQYFSDWWSYFYNRKWQY